MSDIRVAAALEAARPTIERLLRATFEQLDALTPDVEVRRQLYAGLISRAAGKAEERLPGSIAIREAVAELVGAFHPRPADGGSFGHGEPCTS